MGLRRRTGVFLQSHGPATNFGVKSRGRCTVTRTGKVVIILPHPVIPFLRVRGPPGRRTGAARNPRTWRLEHRARLARIGVDREQKPGRHPPRPRRRRSARAHRRRPDRAPSSVSSARGGARGGTKARSTGSRTRRHRLEGDHAATVDMADLAGDSRPPPCRDIEPGGERGNRRTPAARHDRARCPRRRRDRDAGRIRHVIVANRTLHGVFAGPWCSCLGLADRQGNPGRIGKVTVPSPKPAIGSFEAAAAARIGGELLRRRDGAPAPACCGKRRANSAPDRRCRARSGRRAAERLAELAHRLRHRQVAHPISRRLWSMSGRTCRKRLGSAPSPRPAPAPQPGRGGGTPGRGAAPAGRTALPASAPRTP